MEPKEGKASSAKMLKALVRKALPTTTTRGRKRPREELEAPAAPPPTASAIEPVERAPTRLRYSSAAPTAHPPARRQLLFGPTSPGVGLENIAPPTQSVVKRYGPGSLLSAFFKNSKPALVSAAAQPEKKEVPPSASRTAAGTAPRPAKRVRAKAFSFSQLQYTPTPSFEPTGLLTTFLAGSLAKTRRWSGSV